jgi:(R,R)-butanediol dehydrogenase / meso-butanediol dehydrogenase / diacetyl reductase
MPRGAFYAGDRTFRVGDSPNVSPSEGEVTVDTAYCGVCGTDLHIYLGHMDARVAMPQVIGHEMSGVVSAVGGGVERWSPGDRVVVRPLDPCGDCPACAAGHSHICQNLDFLGIDTPGAFQTHWTVPAHTLHRLPDSVDDEIGALIEPLAVACHDVRLGEVAEGERAVVIGAGPIGTLVALVARHAGADVLMTEVNPYRVEFARSLGFETLHGAEADVATHVQELTDGAGADVVFEVSGSQAGAELMTKLARTRGRIVVVAIHAEPPKVDLFQFFWRELKLCGVRVYEPEDFEEAIRLAESGALPLDRLITHRAPLTATQSIFDEIASGAEMMKALIDAREA